MQGQPIDFSTAGGGSGGGPCPTLYPRTIGLAQGPAELLELRGLDFDGSSTVEIFEGPGFPAGLPTISAVTYVAGVAPALDTLRVELDTSLASGDFAAVVTAGGCRTIAAFVVVPP
jgi:hypothetical protein